MKTTIETIKISDLNTKKGTQFRVTMDQKWIDELAEKIRELKIRTPSQVKPEDKIDPIGVVRTPEGHIIPWDGFQRIQAHKDAKVTEIEVEITEGDIPLARLLAYGANARHGKQRTNADKKKIVEAMLVDKYYMASNPSNMEMARTAGISTTIIRKLRPVTEDNAVRTVKKNGKEVKVNIKNSGKKGAAAKPTPPAKKDGKTGVRSFSNPGKDAADVPSAEGSGNPSEPETKTVTLEDFSPETQKSFKKITASLGEEKGAKIVEAFLSDALPKHLNEKTIQAWASTSKEKVASLEPLLIGENMTLTQARAILDQPVDLKTKVERLIHLAISGGGSTTETVEGEEFSICIFDRNKFDVSAIPK